MTRREPTPDEIKRAANIGSALAMERYVAVMREQLGEVMGVPADDVPMKHLLGMHMHEALAVDASQAVAVKQIYVLTDDEEVISELMARTHAKQGDIPV